MNKNILVVYYSQSGQLKSIAEKFCAPFREENCEVEWMPVKPKNDFPFPWSGKTFFNVMPESVLGIPAEILTPGFKREHYDLIVFAYQPWFLSPSIPATSVLHHPEFKKRLINTPVITLVGSRNMWITAQEKVKKILRENGAIHVANIVLCDRNNNFVSAVTIQYWMFTGRRDHFLGIFPRPGISDKDIDETKIFGKTVLESLETGNWHELQERLIKMKAVGVNTNLMFIESRASVLFKIWAQTIIKKKNREVWLQIFKYYLLFALFIVAPIVLLIYNICIRPFTGNQIRKNKIYYRGVN
ncbi:MAG TPA: hypothetical protein VJY62_04805 [Bacteroidia bacterium]|nr:hypothetical protein [Bacteroidia bacterium]